MMFLSCASQSMDDESMLMRKLACLSHGKMGKKHKAAALRMEKACDFPEAPPPAAPAAMKSRKPSVRSNDDAWSSGGEMVVARQDFDASVVDEISVARGEIFRLLYVDGEWAFIATCNSKREQRGFIPIAYCQYMTEEEIERTRKRVVKFEDDTSPQGANPPEPAPRTVGPAAIVNVQRTVESPTSSAAHAYHSLQPPGQVFSAACLMSQSMVAIPQKILQSDPSPPFTQTRPYATTAMPQNFSMDRQSGAYENCESSNASMPNLTSIPSGSLPRKMARPRGFSPPCEADNYIVPMLPVQPFSKPGRPAAKETRRPQPVRCDDLMSIDSQSLASLTGTPYSESATSLVVNLPGAYPSSTAIPAYTAKVLFNFNADGQASTEHIRVLAGDVVNVIGQDGDDWLWVKTSDDNHGLIPSCFLKPLSSDTSDDRQTPVQASRSIPSQQAPPAGQVKPRKMATGAAADRSQTYENELISRLNGAETRTSLLGAIASSKATDSSSTQSGHAPVHGVRSARRASVDSRPSQRPEDSDLSRWLEKHSFTSVSAPGSGNPHQALHCQNSVAFSIISSMRTASGEYSNLQPPAAAEQQASPRQSSYGSGGSHGATPPQDRASKRSTYIEHDAVPVAVTPPLPPPPCGAGHGRYENTQKSHPSVAQLATNLGNLVVVAPQPQQQPPPKQQQPPPQQQHPPPQQQRPPPKQQQPPPKQQQPPPQQQQPPPKQQQPPPKQQAPKKLPKPPTNPGNSRPPVAPKPKCNAAVVNPSTNAAPTALPEKEKLYNMSSYSSLPENFRCPSSASAMSYPADESIYSSAEDVTALAYEDYEDVEDDDAVSRLEVICDFTATGLNQVSVRDGMIVIANIAKSTRGWLWIGVEETGKQGFIPLSYTQPYETWAG